MLRYMLESQAAPYPRLATKGTCPLVFQKIRLEQTFLVVSFAIYKPIPAPGNHGSET